MTFGRGNFASLSTHAPSASCRYKRPRVHCLHSMTLLAINRRNRACRALVAAVRPRASITVTSSAFMRICIRGMNSEKLSASALGMKLLVEEHAQTLLPAHEQIPAV